MIKRNILTPMLWGIMLFTLGCEPETLISDYTFAAADKKISVWGGVSLQQGISLRIAESTEAVGTINYKELGLKNPKVHIQVNQDKIIELAADAERFYTNLNDYSLQSGDVLQLTAIADNLPAAISTPVVIPTQPIINNLQFYDTGEQTINSLPVWKLNFDLELEDQESYYAVDLTVFDQETQLDVGGSFETWFNTQNADLCDFRKGGGFNLYFSTNCTDEKRLNVDLNIQLDERFSYNGEIYPSIEQVKINVLAIDESLYEFIKTTSSIRPNDLYLSEPYITHSNMENGYGVFYATNRIDTIIRVR